MSDWVIRLIEQSGYLGVGFLMFLETVFPPIPSEVIMPVAGMAAAEGKMSFPLVVASGTSGAMLGNIVWYLAARALGVQRLEPIIRRHGRWVTMTWKEVERGITIEQFHLKNAAARIKKVGDLWKPLLSTRGRIDLATFMEPRSARKARKGH